MAHTVSTMLSRGIQALLRLVHFLFGRQEVKDVEAGGLSTKVTTVRVEDEKVIKEAVLTYQPELEGLPALTLASMAMSAALIPKIERHSQSLTVPTIVITAPLDDDVQIDHTKVVERRLPLNAVTNAMRRVHGQTPPRTRHGKSKKENIREHPNAPCRPRLVSPAPSPLLKDDIAPVLVVPLVLPVPPTEALKASEPGSSEWEEEKAMRLKEARAWTDAIKNRRRCSLPTLPPLSSSSVIPSQLARRVSAPARIPLQERLRRAVSGEVPVVKVAPLWGDLNAAFVLDDEEEDKNAGEEGVSVVPVCEARTIPEGAYDTLAVSTSSSLSISSSISSLLDALEADFTSPAWLGLQSLADLEEGRLARAQEDQWSEVLSLEDYV
ncbi:hypothetical protein C8R44DRAFT_727455 [Mycena epipterygia]|nr:hypothetical protein C8R44DRAFT_727455 [Mycena epipterygia]